MNMRKIFGGLLGIVVGFISWQLIKVLFLLSGSMLLEPIGISGKRAADNLEALAEIVGFIVFILVLRNIYNRITNKPNKVGINNE